MKRFADWTLYCSAALRADVGDRLVVGDDSSRVTSQAKWVATQARRASSGPAACAMAAVAAR